MRKYGKTELALRLWYPNNEGLNHEGRRNVPTFGSCSNAPQCERNIRYQTLTVTQALSIDNAEQVASIKFSKYSYNLPSTDVLLIIYNST